MSADKQNQSILITGGTGFIGSALIEEFSQKGYMIYVLTRSKLKTDRINIKFINDIYQDVEYDIVINLSGAPISQRWTKKAKEEIYDSRINVTQKIVDFVNAAKTPPKLIISGSAIGYYGTSNELVFDENSNPTSQGLFSQKLCLDWEEKIKKTEGEVRLVIIRIGVVVGKNGGIIKKMFLPFSLGLGGKIGTGNQYLSWVSLIDVMGGIDHIIRHEDIRGPVNLTAPMVTTNKIFSQTLAKVLKRPCFFDMPSIIAKILFGQMARELLLAGQNVVPKKMLESGYEFKIKDLEEAILHSL
jgi:hypothetical protein